MNKGDAKYMTAVEHARGFIMDAARGEEDNQTLSLVDIVEGVEVNDMFEILLFPRSISSD